MLKKSIRDKWSASLRSGAYRKTTGLLRRKDRMCFLGVLCDLHSKETGIPWIVNNFGEYQYKNNGSTLCDDVIEWAGINSELGPRFPSGTLYRNSTEYGPWAQDKNKNVTFKRLADALDKLEIEDDTVPATDSDAVIVTSAESEKKNVAEEILSDAKRIEEDAPVDILRLRGFLEKEGIDLANELELEGVLRSVEELI